MLEAECPECGSDNIYICHTPLCSEVEATVIYRAVCMECKKSFHLKYILKDPQVIPLERLKRKIKVSKVK